MSMRRDKNGHTYKNTHESKDARKKNTHRVIKRQCHKNETEERREHEKDKNTHIRKRLSRKVPNEKHTEQEHTELKLTKGCMVRYTQNSEIVHSHTEKNTRMRKHTKNTKGN